jgi:hypothetical protein
MMREAATELALIVVIKRAQFWIQPCGLSMAEGSSAKLFSRTCRSKRRCCSGAPEYQWRLQVRKWRHTPCARGVFNYSREACKVTKKSPNC